MKKLIAVALSAAAVIALMTGCKTALPTPSPVTLNGIELASQTFISTDLLVRPGDLPLDQAAQGVICGLGGSTNSAAGSIGAALTSLNLGGKLDVIAIANLNGLIGMVTQLESSNTNSAAISAIAGAVCTGIGNGITLYQSKP